jgi:hypothetical protein
MPERNVELLEKTMQHILDHPEEHDQKYWFTQTECGTAACFAGWACLLSGYEVDRTQTMGSGHDRFEYVVSESGNFAGHRARDILGLTETEASILFDSYNSREALQLMVKDLVNGDEMRQPDEYMISVIQCG